jgi:hypothetical protein
MCWNQLRERETVLSEVKTKTEQDLRGLSESALAQRLKDVSETIAMIKRQRKRGYDNPQVRSALKKEKKLIVKIQKERS